MKKKKNWSVYVVRCKDASLYTGISNDVKHRIKSHNSGKGAKYITAARRPVKLLYVEEGFDVGGALKREYAIKHSGKPAKELLVKRKRKPKMNDDQIFEKKKELFECARCGNCCEVPGYVFINIKEAQIMAKALAMPYDEFYEKSVRKVGHQHVLKTPFKGGCIFWKDKKCTIYEARPSQCRTFPYWKELTSDHKEWKEIEKYCEGAKRIRF
jgi:predicted GIY-YIG superfamily endonuclease/Fe-S-cluster containining protein